MSKVRQVRTDKPERSAEASIAAASLEGALDDLTFDEITRKRAQRRAAAELAATRVLADASTLREAVPRVLQAICENLRWQWGALWEVDAEARTLRCFALWSEPTLDTRTLADETRAHNFPRGAGLPGRVWSSGTPRFVGDIAGDATLARRDAAIALGMRSALGVPVVLRGEILGVFELLSLEQREPDDELLAMFTNIGGQLGQFMEKKRIEEERDLFFAVSLEMLCLLGGDGVLRRVNPAWQRTLGYTPQELLSAPLLDFVHDADRERTAAELARLRQGIDTTFFEHRVRAKDGSIRWLSWTCPGAQPGQSVLFAAVRDVTLVKESEDALRHGEEQLRHAQKMEATGRLAGWTAHYFNNLLTAILGYSRLMVDRLCEDDPLRDYAKNIQNAGERAASLTQQLLAFSRRQTLRPRVVSLNGVVVDMDRMLRPLLGDDVELITVLASECAPVRADRGQLEQVLLNLVLNARDAMTHGGRITVETKTVQIEADGPSPGPRSPGRYTVLTVADDGVGMDADLRSRAFEPFFTTKRLGDGVGLGLSMVYGIVEQSGGHMRLDSEPRAGTRVEVFLPAASEESPALLAEVRPPAILVVDDEDAVRQVIAVTLRGAGYAVITAKDADEAVRLAREQPGPLELVLTDVALRGASGRDLALAIVALHPEAKVLYLSPYASETVARHGVVATDVFLAKPFTAEALERKVARVLAPKTSAE